MKVNNTKKVTVRFSEQLKQEMREALAKLNYKAHEKSRWLNEAIKWFLNDPAYVDLVEHGMSINQGNLVNVEGFYLDQDLRSIIRSSLLAIRLKHPLIEGVQSALIRSSIIYRLMLKK